MAEVSLTLKLPFYRLNQVKVLESKRLTAVNTQVANELLRVDRQERKKLTSATFRHIEIGSMWINQTIRNANAKTRVKHGYIEGEVNDSPLTSEASRRVDLSPA